MSKTTEQITKEDREAENRAWDSAEAAVGCHTGNCIHNQPPERSFRIGFQAGLNYARRSSSNESDGV